MAAIQASTDGYENHTLLAKIDNFYLKNETADVYFVFGDDDNRERVPAHKILLAAGSDVFNAMFYGDLKEKGDVEITDASADAFKEFLQFFYRSKVNLTVENAFDVVNLGKKYDVVTCRTICDRFLKDELTLRNDSVCSIYGLATYFDIDDVKKLCESKIVEDTEAAFSSSSFLDCDHSVLSRILKFDELSCTEVNVFHACMNWVKAKAKQEEITREIVRVHLGDLFYEIRVGSMTLEELADLTASYGELFSLDEHNEIVQIIKFNDFQPKMFKKDRRQFLWNRNAIAILCNRTNEKQIEKNVRSQMSNIPWSLQVQELNMSASKDWHNSITQDTRIHFVYKVVEEIFLTIGVLTISDKRMQALTACAKKFESDMYERANSRSQYTQLLAKTIYKVKIKLEHKRQERIE